MNTVKTQPQTEGERSLLEYLEQLKAEGFRIQLQLWPTSDFTGLSTIRRTPTNICKVEANTTPRYTQYEEISEGFYDELVTVFHS